MDISSTSVVGAVFLPQFHDVLDNAGAVLQHLPPLDVAAAEKATSLRYGSLGVRGCLGYSYSWPSHGSRSLFLLTRRLRIASLKPAFSIGPCPKLCGSQPPTQPKPWADPHQNCGEWVIALES